MAVKPDSKGNVKGTKNADKIIFGTSSEWQKALTVNAGAGADTIDFKKSKYKNTLNGEAGNDTIYGGTNIDIIKGGLGTDLIYGYNGKDELYGDAGKDTIYGGNGDDYLNGGADNDKLYGDAGTDTLMGGDGNDSLYGGDGIDSMVGGNGDDYIEGGAGFGRLFGLTGNDTIKGGKDKDTIDGGDDKDVLYGGGDSDTIKGNKGNDILYGEDGNDYLYGMNDNDTLYGGVGNDLLDGGPGNDSLIGGDGNDTVRAGADNDYVDSGNGDDFIQGHGGKDTIKGGNGNDTIEGNDGDDEIYGEDGNDLLRGGNGNDTIYTGEGNDIVDAGAGNDTINSDFGDNIIDVRNGANTIVYDTMYPTTLRTDTIKNFKETDTLQFNDGSSGYLYLFDFNEEGDYLTIGSGRLKINIPDYSMTTRDGYIKIGNDAAMKISEYMVGQHIWQSVPDVYVYDNEDNILGNYEYDTYTHGHIYTRGGNDTIIGYRYTNGKTLYLHTGAGDDSITGVSTNTEVYAGDGNDYISAEYTYNDTKLYGGSGNDIIRVLKGQEQSARLYGDEGDDLLEGGNYMRGGDGNDTIIAYHNNKNDDHSANIGGGKGDDELRRYEGNTDYISYYYSLVNDNGNDIAFDDLMGQSVISFEHPSSEQTSSELTLSELEAIFNESLRYKKNGNDLIIEFKTHETDEYGNNSITFKDFITSENQNNLKISLNSNTFTVISDIAEKGYTGEEINGTEGNDILNGTDGNDTISGGDGNDFIYAGRGNDEIHAGAGNNTIAFYNNYYYNNSNSYDSNNDGNDIVYTNEGGIDTLDFGQCIAVEYAKSNNDLIISYNYGDTWYWTTQSSVTLKDFYNSSVNNSTLYIKLLGQDAVELDPETLSEDVINTHNSSILQTSDNIIIDDGNDYYIYGNPGDNNIIINSNVSGTYYLDGGDGNDTYNIFTLSAKTIIYDSDNSGTVDFYQTSKSNMNVFYDMQVTIEDENIIACDYNSLRIFATGQFENGVYVMANPNLAGQINGFPAQSITSVVDKNDYSLDVLGLAQATAAWVGLNKENGTYSTAELVSQGGDDAAAILGIATGDTYVHSYKNYWE